MSYEHGQVNLPVDGLSVGSPSTSATHVARTDWPHLVDPEWEVLQRLSTVIGEAAVATMLRTLSPTEQHGVALGFIIREQHEVAAAKPVSPGKTPRKEYLKLRVSNYMGREGETLLRWLVELDTTVMARHLVDPLAKVAFVMSGLGGRTRCWAYGRRLTDPTCFSTYEFINGPVCAGRPTGNAVTCVYNGNVILRTAALSERESHSEVQDDMPNLVILKVKEARNSHRFSYKHRVFVEELLDLDLDDKFDMVLGMPWLARHDPIIDWEKRTVVRFGRRGATESDGPVSAADTPNGASEPPSETEARAAVSGRPTRGR
ncbi:hypothetical protein PHMEG_00029210 [Phytophthora megakarya]|uniref:Reverse transcriptase n=1 Tax=Phytophthora megakarya TaxID=4795 RepID=A0A225V392_9STRA|nr:hypothetical protein PHMEG_00029210 [Phytophthora megakarya]